MSKPQLQLQKFKTNKSKNTVATSLTWLGWIVIVFGMLVGFNTGGHGHVFNMVLAAPFWLSGLVGGGVLIGLSELINQTIKSKR